MAAFSIISETYERSERDTSRYIFKNIAGTKLVLIHEKMPDIITNR